MTVKMHVMNWQEFPNDLSSSLKALNHAGCHVNVVRREIETQNKTDDQYQLQVLHRGRELVNVESTSIMGLAPHAEQAHQVLAEKLNH